MSQFTEEREVEGSGLARDIRAAITSEQFDLGGYTEQRAHDLIHSAFKTPLSGPTEMIRFTLVVGGGKLVRSRYPEELPKWVVAALREIGYTEDRSAAETFDSQGTFKQQHDTGQNLKYVIVYPHVACSQAKKGGEKTSTDAVMDESSPEFIVIASEVATFQDIVAAKFRSYNQKKKLLKFLQVKDEEYKAIEAKLVSGEKLSSQEQFIYDNNSGNLTDKINSLQNLIKEMVDQGHLTNKEKSELLKSIEHNITATKEEIEATKKENKPKKVEKLEAKLEASVARKGMVEKISPLQPRLEFGDEIRKLYYKIFPLSTIEEKSRSMSLTLADLKLLEEKPDLESQIIEFQNKSKGWFEEDSDFQERCQFEETEAKRLFKHRQAEKKNKPSSSSSGGVKPVSKPASSLNAWTTIGKKPSGATGGFAGAAKKPSSSYAAAFDDDSD
jgi:polyhydroxyalkanoate synthesis regulator phasin